MEALITQASGVQEVLTGEWNVTAVAADKATEAGATPAGSGGAFTISLVSSSLSRSPSARPPFVTSVARRYTVDPVSLTLTYEIDMATEKTTELQNHLKGTLSKKQDA